MGKHLEKYLPVIFDNDGSRGTDQFFDEFKRSKVHENRVFELNSNLVLLLDVLHYAFTNRHLLLERYSPYQLANSLENLFNPALAEFDFIFQNRDLDLEKQVATIQALGPLMIDIFEPHAEPIFGHLSMSVKDNRNEILNHPCYMFWDTAYIPYNCDKAVVIACVDAMGLCARSTNPALVEGGLHGLGHAVKMYDEEIDAHIRNCINQANLTSSEALADYAARARTGMVL